MVSESSPNNNFTTCDSSCRLFGPGSPLNSGEIGEILYIRVPVVVVVSMVVALVTGRSDMVGGKIGGRGQFWRCGPALGPQSRVLG